MLVPHVVSTVEKLKQRPKFDDLRYHVFLHHDCVQEAKQLLVTKRKVTLTDLRPDTTYTVRVQAVNSVGRGGFSPVLRLATRPLPPAPPRLECASASHNTLKLKWADGESYFLGISRSPPPPADTCYHQLLSLESIFSPPTHPMA
jgi:hypothetical protein